MKSEKLISLVLSAVLLLPLITGCQSEVPAPVGGVPAVTEAPAPTETIQPDPITTSQTIEAAVTAELLAAPDTAIIPKITETAGAVTEPVPTETEPVPAPTESSTPTEPEPKTTEPAPVPTEPKPTEPKPTETKPTEPKPTEPKPTDPAPTEPPHTHSWSAWAQTTAPTCGAAGEETRTCSCGVKETRPVSATGNHAWSETAPTCTQAGNKTCTVCGKTQTLAALGHDMKFTKTVAPTTSSGGYDLYTCSRCGATEHRNPTDKLEEVIDLNEVIEYGLAYAQSLGYTVDRSMNLSNSSYYPGYAGNGYSTEFLKKVVADDVRCTTDDLIACGEDPRGVARCNFYASYNKEYPGKYYIVFLYG